MNRPKKPPTPADPRAVIRGARRAIHGPDPSPAVEQRVAEYRAWLLTLPEDHFQDGVQAEKHLRENACPNGEQPYGPYIKPEPGSGNTRAIGGKGMYALFPDFMLAWFDRQTEPSLAAIDRVTKREMRRLVVREILKENWLRMVTVGGAVWAAFQWGVDALIWLGGKWPAAAAAWKALRGG